MPISNKCRSSNIITGDQKMTEKCNETQIKTNPAWQYGTVTKNDQLNIALLLVH